MSDQIGVSCGDYQDAVDSYTGWCRDCREFTRGCTEPDAEDYECPSCGERRVMGAEQAMLLGYIIVEG